MRKHALTHNVPIAGKVATHDSGQDFIRNYSRNAMLLCLIANDFEDARKHGDGLRIIRLLKFMMLFFKHDGKRKYVFHILHHLAQIKFLLPPKLAHDIVWNRFVNHCGKVDSNLEMDREVEHHNRAFKLDCRLCMGKVTDNSISRSSCSYQQTEDLLAIYDKCSSVKTMSGKHPQPNMHKDVEGLATDLHSAQIFSNIPGRCHKAFPSFPRTVLQTLEPMKLKQWMIDKLEEFQKLSIYNKEHF